MKQIRIIKPSQY